MLKAARGGLNNMTSCYQELFFDDRTSNSYAGFVACSGRMKDL